MCAKGLCHTWLTQRSWYYHHVVESGSGPQDWQRQSCSVHLGPADRGHWGPHTFGREHLSNHRMKSSSSSVANFLNNIFDSFWFWVSKWTLMDTHGWTKNYMRCREALQVTQGKTHSRVIATERTLLGPVYTLTLQPWLDDVGHKPMEGGGRLINWAVSCNSRTHVTPKADSDEIQGACHKRSLTWSIKRSLFPPIWCPKTYEVFIFRCVVLS